MINMEDLYVEFGNLFIFYLKINVESSRISCSYHHETLHFGISESWSNYEEIKVKMY